MSGKERRIADKSKKKRDINRRAFFKDTAIIGGILGSTLLASRLGYDLLRRSQEESELNDFRAKILIPEYNLTPQEEKMFTGESWFDDLRIEIPPNYFQLPPTEQTKYLSGSVGHVLSQLLTQMENSSYQPFRETAQIIDKHALIENQEVSTDGQISKHLEYFGIGESSEAVFKTGINIDPTGKLWWLKLAANISILDPNNKGKLPQGFLTKATWAIGLVHEIQGHYALADKTIEFWKKKGLSLDQAIAKTKEDSAQEPFAYGVQSAVSLPILHLKKNNTLLSQKVPGNFAQITKDWQRAKSMGIKWSDPQWKKIVEDQFK